MLRTLLVYCALWLTSPLVAAAGEAASSDPGAGHDCAKTAEPSVRSGNADPKPAGQDEAIRALMETAKRHRSAASGKSDSSPTDPPPPDAD